LAIPFVNGLIIACFYLFVRTGASLGASRIALVKSDFYHHFTGVCRQIWEVFIIENGKIIRYGIEDGLSLIWSQDRMLYLMAILAVGLATFFIGRASLSKKATLKPLLLGLLLFLAGLSPFFVLEGSVITLRCAVVPFLGLALMADAAARGLFVKVPKFYGVLCMAIAVIFIVGSVAETDLYRKTGEQDQKQVTLLTKTLAGASADDRIGVIAAPEYYDFNRIRFYEHSYSVFSSQWALSGAVRAISEDRIRAKIYPIRPDNWLHPGYDDFNSYTGFWGYEKEGLKKLTMQKSGENFLFLDQAGKLFATARKKMEGYYLEMPNT
jgi:hypothetical protein